MRRRLGVLAGVLGAVLAAVELVLLQLSVEAEVWVRFDAAGHVHGHVHGLVVLLGFAAAAVLIGGVLGAGAIPLGVVRRALRALRSQMPGQSCAVVRFAAADDTVLPPVEELHPRGARGPRAPGWAVRRPPHRSLLVP